MKQITIGHNSKIDSHDSGASYYHHKQSNLSLKKKLAIAIPAIAASLAALALVLFPTANQLASALTITSVDVKQGPVTGQNEVTIHGSGFLTEQKDSIKQISDQFILTNDDKVLFAPYVKSGNGNYADFEHTQDITDKFKLSDEDKISKLTYIYTNKTVYMAISTNGDVYQISSADSYATISSVDNITSKLNLPIGEKVISVNYYYYYQENSILSQSGKLYIINKDNDGNITGTTDITNIFNLQSGDGIKRVIEYGGYAVSNNGNVYEMSYDSSTKTYSAADITNKFNGDKIESISSDGASALALSTTGNIYVWGGNNSGQLGFGDTTDIDNPTKLNYNFDGKVTKILNSSSSSYALTDTGNLYAWGSNDAGRLGIDNNGQKVTTPTLVSTDNSAVAGKKIIGLSDTGNMAWSDDGSVFAWGNMGWSGQCVQAGHRPSPPDQGGTGGRPDNSPASPNQPGEMSAYAASDTTNCAIPNDITSWFKFSSTTKSNVSSIYFASLSALSFNVIDNNTITAIVPASYNLQPGKVDVTLTDIDNKTTTLTKGYEYIADKGDGDNTDDNDQGGNNGNNNQPANPPVNKDNNNHVIPTVPNTGL